MIRIAGVDLPDTKAIKISLTYIYGIGLSRAREILTMTDIDFNKKTKLLEDKEVSQLRDLIERNYTTESDLKRQLALNIKRLIEINCYRGRRHIKSLPVRGQRTRTNAQTRKRRAPKSKLKSKG